VEPLQPEATGNSEALKQMTLTALAFFTGAAWWMWGSFGRSGLESWQWYSRP
jgi:hypothetical protein